MPPCGRQWSSMPKSTPMPRTRLSGRGTAFRTGPLTSPATRWWRRWTRSALTARSTSRRSRCTSTTAAMRSRCNVPTPTSSPLSNRSTRMIRRWPMSSDGSQVGPLLEQIAGPVASFTGDGAYDRDDVYREVCQRHPDAAVIVPPRSGAVPSAMADSAPTKRDRHLQLIAERGRMGWQRVSGYNWRALVEADIGRYKRVIGDALRSRTKGRQMTEVAIAVASLNRMLELGRPEYVRPT